MASAVAMASTSYGNVTGFRRATRRTSRRATSIRCACQHNQGEQQHLKSQSRHSSSAYQDISTGRRIALVTATLTLLSKTVAASAVIEQSKVDTIRDVLRQVISKSKAPGLLRLVFHDAGTYNVSQRTGGINGSIIHELERPENGGLDRAMKILSKAREKLEPSLQVSWADLIAVAGSEAVSICGGPFIPVRLGRLDSSVADPEGELPSENLDAVSLKQSFLRKGFSTQEMVALSGAHTLGNKGFGNPTVFDNSYYKVLLDKQWTDGGNNMATSMIGLPSDRGLVEDKDCLKWLVEYKEDESKFFADFSAAYTKLVDSTARWES